ncbi:tRNA preQ1(34) S-adenosylmethionine ribosyltransferase-isomerase QueA [Oscillatoriales cyanobacterium USR001]|nr:tRNA preQ1(34) S-adenosylmethionine ribosyltransferase-isomerase QueA [Oscillatoriales cyanobacterium USR001]
MIEINLSLDLKLEAYNYELPPERIAQNPVIPRDSSRLLVVDSPTTHRHCIFRELPDFLQPGDLLVLNNTRVLPARLRGHKPNGSRVEVLLMEEKEDNCWLALVKPGKRLKPGAQIEFEPLETGVSSNSQGLSATVLAREEGTGGRYLQFEVPDGMSLIQLLPVYGHVPLPPYIRNSQSLGEQYQTVYAEKLGAIAAPTAGLHFTDELFKRLQEKGIEKAFVTLHVGVGTFRPVEVEDVTAHQMHREWVEVSAETVAKIRQTQAKGGRIIAVGTTAVRSLEGVAAWAQKQNLPSIEAFCGYVDLFIYPSYEWRVVEGLITNFHLPCSSLLMLVSAMIGRRRLFDLYEDAIAQQYRFYSFGDAMLILPEGNI